MGVGERVPDWEERGEVAVNGTRVGIRRTFDGAQVMLGGAKCRRFCPETLESKLAPGLYACGELFDVTGPCGGYNLAWAWASGCLAGRSAAKSL